MGSAELLGYFQQDPAWSDGIITPEYRAVDGQWFDEFDRRLQISQLDLQFINEIRLQSGVPELEGLAGVDGVFALPMPAQAASIRENPEVGVSTFRFKARSVSQVLTSIRSQLVDRLARIPTTSKHIAGSAADDEIIELRPNLAGIGVNLRALWRKIRSG